MRDFYEKPPTQKDFDYAIEVMRLLESKADNILDYMKNRGSFVRFTDHAVIYKVNTSCSCHPDFHEESFPVSWLFRQDWKQLVDLEKNKEKQQELNRQEARRLVELEEKREQLKRLQEELKQI